MSYDDIVLLEFLSFDLDVFTARDFLSCILFVCFFFLSHFAFMLI